jgi:SAM-dependent methyltransferase
MGASEHPGVQLAGQPDVVEREVERLARLAQEQPVVRRDAVGMGRHLAFEDVDVAAGKEIAQMIVGAAVAEADLEAAAAHAHRILRPGGVLLCTVPSVSRIEPGSVENEYWRFTTASCAHLFDAAFPGGAVIVRSHGNVLVSIAFLAGMAAEELRQSQLDENDPHFPLIVTVRAEKRR